MSKFVMVTCMPEEGQAVKKEEFEKCLRVTFPKDSKDVVVIDLNNIEPEVLEKFIDNGMIDCFAFTPETLGSETGKKITARVLGVDRSIGRNTQFLNVYNGNSEQNIETSVAVGNLMLNDGYGGNLLHFDINDDERIRSQNLIGVKNSTLRTKEKLKTKVKDVMAFADQVVEDVSAKVGEYTKRHMQSVAEISAALARKAGISEEEVGILKAGALMHDIGKQDVADEIINSGRRLTDEEFGKMRAHVLLGEIEFDMVDLDDFERAKEIADQHHERYDGRGYPRGLKGNQIDPMARILAVADATNAMFGRDYDERIKTKDDIVRILGECGGLELPEKDEKGKLDISKIKEVPSDNMQFDPKYAKLMIDILENEPDSIGISYEKDGRVTWMDKLREQEAKRAEKVKSTFSENMKEGVNSAEELAEKDMDVDTADKPKDAQKKETDVPY